MFFRTSALHKVGLLDRRFFLIFEEVDWCYRAGRVGFRCLFVPKARVWHRVSASFGGRNSLVYEYFLFRNRLLWAERNLDLMRLLRIWAYTLDVLFPPWRVGLAFWRVLRRRSRVKWEYWEARRLVRKWLDELRDPNLSLLRRMQWKALMHYVVRRFGDCPASVRAGNTKI